MARGEDITSTCTTCPYCGVGCGVVASITPQNEVCVKGDPDHPANFGRLCSKGSALAETLGDEDRLLHPEIDGHRATWDKALDKVADKFAAVIDEHGPDAVAFYVSGQFLTEDYYVANKLMKGYIGSGNIDTNSRLCMASSVVGHKRAFGSDTVPSCYEDLEQTDLIVLTGSNLAWCHPVLYQRIVAAKEQRPQMKIIVIDPRETASCDLADLHLPLAPGSDVPLFQGLFKYLDAGGYVDKQFIANHTNDYEAAHQSALAYDLEIVAHDTGLETELIKRFYRLFANTPKIVTVYSQGVNQARDGSDKVNAIINCHLLTGRIGAVGAGPFSVTGQPNAMGGREVGGLANQLASHMDIENPDHRALVRRFWNAPTMADKAGLKAVDLFEAIHAGKVKAVWIMATNPVDSMPNANRVKDALETCELVVVSDIVRHTDTAACADVLLPATGWGEKDGTVTNSERRISRQRAFLPTPGETRHDWWQICEVAKRMGWEEAFSFQSSAGIFREYAGLSAFENEDSRDLNLSGLADITDLDYEKLAPIQWPVTKAAPKGAARFFGDGRFYTPNRKANFVAPQKTEPRIRDAQYPFTLNSGRIRDQWHTMTRTGRSARLSQHICEPFVEVHPSDGKILGLSSADITRIKTRQGEMMARVVLTKRQRQGSIFVPMHFTDRFASAGRIGALTAAELDPASGQPAFKSTPATLSKFDANWYGFAVIANDVFEVAAVPAPAHYWAKARTDKGLRIEMAGEDMPESWPEFVQNLLGRATDNIEILDMTNPLDGQTRLACFEYNHLVALLYTANAPVAVSRDWACTQLLNPFQGSERHRLLAGRPGADMPDKGPIICACMNVGLNDIKEAVQEGCGTLEAVGEFTTAGTNCGSCKAEIRTLLKELCFAKVA